MFRFVYALGPDELPRDATLLTSFEGVETNAACPDVPVIGRRVAYADLDQLTNPPAYVVVTAPEGFMTAPAVGQRLRGAAERWPDTLILIENGGAFAAAPQLWDLMEAANHPRVKVAWRPERIEPSPDDVSARSAAVIVPTLNLRIGAVRVRGWNEQIAAYTRRLAGIGFEGWCVVDPEGDVSDGASRLEWAAGIVAQIRHLLEPPKPTKAAAPRRA